MLHTTKRLLRLFICIFFPLLAMAAIDYVSAGEDEKIIISDQANRKVEVARDIKRVVALNVDAARILVSLGEQKKMVGIDGWETRCSILKQVFPEVKTIPIVGGVYGGTLSLEKLAEVQPDVVFISGLYPDVADSIQTQTGIPVICIYTRVKEYQDFMQSVRLIGKVMNRTERAEEINQVIQSSFQLIASRLTGLPESQKPSILLMGQPFSDNRFIVSTYFALLPYIGATYAPEGTLKPKTSGGPGLRVSMEQILTWDPDIIFLSGMALFGPEDLQNDPLWQKLRAVGNKKVYKISTGHMGYELANFAIMPLAMSKLLHPTRFSDIDMESTANLIIKKLYGVSDVYSSLKKTYGLTDI